jgi:guanosine-3',5'-bis(diphosphate) 3'-pyrophosphohydrolase
VAEVLARIGGIDDAVTLLAAILHDTVEDTETSFAELDEMFGPEVRAVVAESEESSPYERPPLRSLEEPARDGAM